MGSASTRLPDSPAKRRLALVAAAKAVVIALTPGMPQLQRVTIRPRGDSISRTLFMPQASFDLSTTQQSVMLLPVMIFMASTELHLMQLKELLDPSSMLCRSSAGDQVREQAPVKSEVLGHIASHMDVVHPRRTRDEQVASPTVQTYLVEQLSPALPHLILV